MSPEDYKFLCDMLHKRSGLKLNGDKQYLFDSRMIPVMRRHELASMDALVAAAKVATREDLRVDITEAMTTNETFFFRDKVPFENFAEHVLPYLVRARSNLRRIRIWCAAASTGQEPYSLALLLREHAELVRGWRVEILATDISQEVLDKAKAGMYTQFEVQRGLPIKYLMDNFQQVGDMWQISPEIRRMVQFKPFNLLDGFAALGTFDLVVCRNVLIYFDQETKVDVLKRLSAAMPDDGFLMLGAAETTIGLNQYFNAVEGRRGLHSRIGGAAGRAGGAVGLQQAQSA